VRRRHSCGLGTEVPLRRRLYYGVTLNNNPTLEDLWHSPAWGFPWVASDVGPRPVAGTFTDFSYRPVQNIQLAAQYTGHVRFNGASTNHDGAGQNGLGNNSIYVMLWFIF
jgi:hypothetical protein